jgi:predicted AlkP superfamily pyrophosphatase or phosphodiesterase
VKVWDFNGELSVIAHSELLLNNRVTFSQRMTSARVFPYNKKPRYPYRLINMLRLIAFVVVALFTLCGSAWAERKAEHVFIISFDGGKPSVMKESKMPELMSLVNEGAVTWEAQTIFPSLTLGSHTSMLTGVGQQKHNVTWNEWEPKRGIISSPTIFNLAKSHKLTTAMFVGKPKFIHLYQEKSLNVFSLPSYSAIDAATAAASYIKARKPNLCFIHFADSDTAGHMYGWGSEQQKKAFADEDDSLKIVMAAIKEAGIQKDSVVILSADHGGHDKTHGTNRPEDMTIPWIAWGCGIKPESKITRPVTTYDTAATALWLLDVPRPANFDGQPVTEIFTLTN